MAAPITRETIQRVAELSALSLTDDEATAMVRDIAQILGHVAELEGVDTTGVEPTAHVALERLWLRPDEIEEGVGHDEALSQAPRSGHGGFAVPAFVE